MHRSLRSSALTPDAVQGAKRDSWKTKFTGPNTRSAIRIQSYESNHHGALEFLSLVDSPSVGRKRSRLVAFSPGWSRDDKKKEIIDLTHEDDYEPASKKQTIPFNLGSTQPSSANSNGTPPDQQLLLTSHHTQPVESIDVCENRHIDNAEGRARILTIPAELHQLIARYLDDDADILNLSQVCKRISTYMSDSVWRQRAEAKFDPIPGATTEEVAKEYKERQMMLKTYLRFNSPNTEEHRVCMNRLRDLILQSDAQIITEGGVEKVTGLNLEFLRDYVSGARITPQRHPHGSNILNVICSHSFFKTFLSSLTSHRQVTSKSPASLVMIIQLALLHLVFDKKACTGARQLYSSQLEVYQTRIKQPLFKGKDMEINVAYFLHIANFFQFHFKMDHGEGVLSHVYDTLTEEERPRGWIGKLESGTQSLEGFWKGTYTYLDRSEIDNFRTGATDLHVVDEIGNSNHGLLDLHLIFDIDEHPELHFPHTAEHIIRGKPSNPLRDYCTGMKYMPDVKDFFGMGNNGDEYHLNGRTHNLPPQQGIPGFQRVTMLNYLPDGSGGYAKWAWEGLVLPGSQIMLGRWFDASGDGSYSGPFIFWKVTDKAREMSKTANSAVEFLDEIDWQGI